MTDRCKDLGTLADKKLYIFDMDGTIYLGGRVFDFAVRFPTLWGAMRANGFGRIFVLVCNSVHRRIF